MATLSYRSAAKIAAREMHSSRGKFFFVILSVAIGVAALTGVRGFSSSFRSTLLNRARAIMAADLSARMFQQPTPDQQKALDEIAATGVEITPVTELLSMASSSKTLDPLLVSLKSVDPAMYPFYGQVELAPTAQLKNVLTAYTVAVADDLLVRLNLKVGDQLKIGTQFFRIASVVVNEPDRLSGSFAAGPRVLISREGLEASGLLAPGSHAGQRYLFKVPRPANGAPISDKAVADLKLRLEKLLPEAQVIDYRETNPALTQGLDRATSLLSLMSLVALVLGAIGVAMAMRAHLQQRLDTIAIMKSLGARSGQIIKIYLLQTLLLGLAGGLLGVALGVAVQLSFPHLLARLIHVDTEFNLQPRTVITGLTAGLLTTLLFTLPPLLDIRGVRPILILRRAVEDNDDPFVTAAWRKITKNLAQVAAAILILAGLAAIATTLSDSLVVGEVFSFGLVAVLAVLLLASVGVLAGLRFFLSKTRLHLPSSLRHGLANLYRPGNPSAALLAALGLGVMQIMTVYLVQQAVVSELHVSAAPNLPNVFLIDITNDEVAGIRALLKSQPSVTAPPELLPVVSSRIVEIDGVPANEAKLKNFPKRMLRSISLTWSATSPPGTKTVEGNWWSIDEKRPVVAIEKRQADRLGVQVGSHITFAAQDTQFVATVVALTKSDGQHAYSRAEFILPQPALAGLPVVWYGGVHADPSHVGDLQRALYHFFPTVTVINVAQALETVRAVVMQITYVIQFLAAFSIFAGIIILASSIAGTRYRRIREVVVLKTLGATRARIATVFSIEFAVLGLVAGAVGILFANIIARVLLNKLTVAYHFQWLWTLGALLGTAVLTVATGWVASHRILGRKPLEVLREE
ncbi:FtsX-like permease family protein [Tunturibacter psychrotolerans]|uniref:FtsX-like permease family protein n=1 Tax=Tunturiibacter psychrotolerans TaxID=3069686 RepID=A0AAU7ZLN1_9BACT